MNIMRFLIPKSLVTYLSVDSTVRQALEKMRFHRYVAMPVLDSDGKYAGTVRTDDLLSYILLEGGHFDSHRAESEPVANIMDTDFSRAVHHNATMAELIEKVKEHNFVPVVDDRECFIGIILRRDILNFLLSYYNENDKREERRSDNGRAE